jgi:hexosaminidase
MKFTQFSTLSAVALAALLSSCSESAKQADYNIVPLPLSIEQGEGQADFRLKNGVVISYPSAQPELQKEAQFLADYVKKESGINLTVKADASGKGVIALSTGLDNDNPEAYELKVSADGVSITGASPAGVFYGIQTLRKSLPTEAKAVDMPAVTIEDEPRFAYRGMHLDVARHYFTVDSVKQYIDMLALHNINRFHWHLTEDQGWRIEIKKHPELAEKGSVRKETVIGRNSGVYDGKEYGGYYTQEEAKEIINYAADRHITVIPEIDLPGHMLAALSVYPELGCTGGPYEPWTIWGVSEDVLCAGNDKTYEFIADVLNEIIDLFPSEYIHVGGDECPKTRWEQCPKCQAKIKELGLKATEGHTKEERLQSHVIRFAESVINERGRKMIGWDETLEGGIAPNATIMSWRGVGGGIEAAKQGHDAIMTPNTYFYLDYYQAADTENEPLAIGGYLPLDRVYGYEPKPANLDKEIADHIVGVQANVWTEYMPTFSHVQYMVLPRMAAVSEIGWSAPEKKDYDNFKHRVVRLMDHYAANGYNYAKHLYNIEGSCEPNTADACIDVTLTTVDDAPIVYTLDGTAPTPASTKYEGKLQIKQDAQLRAAAVRKGETGRVFAQDFGFNKATAKTVTLAEPTNPGYTYNGAVTLVDGLNGDTNYKTGRWIGFNGNDLNATIDFGQPTEFASVSVNNNVNWGDWIFDARSLAVEVSDDGVVFTPVKAEQYEALTEANRDERNGIQNHTLTFEPQTARYLRVIMESEKSMPEWHSGKGRPAFMFVDEIVVK